MTAIASDNVVLNFEQIGYALSQFVNTDKTCGFIFPSRTSTITQQHVANGFDVTCSRSKTQNMKIEIST